MQQLTKIDKKTGKKYIINVPSWNDYVVNVNALATDTTSTSGSDTSGGSIVPPSPSFGTRTALGTAVSQVLDTTLTMSGITVSAGNSIIVMSGQSASPVVLITTASWGSTNLTRDIRQTGFAGVGSIEIWSAHGVVGGTNTITITYASNTTGGKGMIASEVYGITSTDVSASVATFSGLPSSGPSPTSSVANEYLCGCIIHNTPTAYSWNPSFIDGQSIQLFSGPSFPTIFEGYGVVSNTGSYTASWTTSSLGGLWIAALVTYK